MNPRSGVNWKLKLSDAELAQLQQLMLLEPLPSAQVTDPMALVDLVGKGLARFEHGFYWPNWERFSKS